MTNFPSFQCTGLLESEIPGSMIGLAARSVARWANAAVRDIRRNRIAILSKIELLRNNIALVWHAWRRSGRTSLHHRFPPVLPLVHRPALEKRASQRIALHSCYQTFLISIDPIGQHDTTFTDPVNYNPGEAREVAPAVEFLGRGSIGAGTSGSAPLLTDEPTLDERKCSEYSFENSKEKLGPGHWTRPSNRGGSLWWSEDCWGCCWCVFS